LPATDKTHVPDKPATDVKALYDFFIVGDGYPNKAGSGQEQLNVQLKATYGVGLESVMAEPEPPAPPPKPEGMGGDAPCTEEELMEYYRQHSPDKVDGVHDVYTYVFSSPRDRWSRGILFLTTPSPFSFSLSQVLH